MLGSHGNSPTSGTPTNVCPTGAVGNAPSQSSSGVGCVAPGSGCPSAGHSHKASAASTANSGLMIGVESSLELEAIAAVHELSFCVKEICVSDLLPRTPELIFVNITTLEGDAYCLELTFKGWRVCSPRHDCMNGDYRRLQLHTRYYETAYALMENVSPGYRQRFSEKLANKLKMLQVEECAAPPSSLCGQSAMTDCAAMLLSEAAGAGDVFAVDAMLDELVPLPDPVKDPGKVWECPLVPIDLKTHAHEREKEIGAYMRERGQAHPHRIDERSRESTIELDDDEIEDDL